MLSEIPEYRTQAEWKTIITRDLSDLFNLARSNREQLEELKNSTKEQPQSLQADLSETESEINSKFWKRQPLEVRPAK